MKDKFICIFYGRVWKFVKHDDESYDTYVYEGFRWKYGDNISTERAEEILTEADEVYVPFRKVTYGL